MSVATCFGNISLGFAVILAEHAWKQITIFGKKKKKNTIIYVRILGRKKMHILFHDQM